MKKIVVYPVSRAYYNNAIPAIKSLLINGNIDEVYIMTESEGMHLPLPENVHAIDVSRQPWFCWGGPNYRNQYSYLCLVRVALAKLFPDAGKILSLDADTIVLKDLSDLWDLDMTDYYLAGVPEEKLSYTLNRPYINMGMALFNLDKIRADQLDDQMIDDLNLHYYQWVEQDCINANCYPKILTLGSEYNASQFSAPCDDPKILHFAYTPGWQDKDIVQFYRKQKW